MPSHLYNIGFIFSSYWTPKRTTTIVYLFPDLREHSSQTENERNDKNTERCTGLFIPCCSFDGPSVRLMFAM